MTRFVYVVMVEYNGRPLVECVCATEEVADQCVVVLRRLGREAAWVSPHQVIRGLPRMLLDEGIQLLAEGRP